MINTITLSTDMETLYLIDNNRAIPFSLLDPTGIVLGLIQGQIAVATAFELPDEAVEPTSGPTNPTDITAPMTSSRQGEVTRVKLSLEKTHWTTVYDPGHLVFAFIGAVEAEIRSENGKDDDYEAAIAYFSLEENNLHIRRKADTINITTLPKS
ncbi:MAG TPA: hypothetical protein PKA00_06190 [Saprospiraceae bacterium]|nr:hypothetical protein [Saprospiraceae bacterium]HMQ82474.1 hypothetical protein [Saprospiraceae bacterium]